MKYIFVLLLATAQLTTFAQLFRTHGYKHLHYADLRGDTGKVYAMGSFSHGPLVIPTINRMDTVYRQPDGSYQGIQSHISQEKDTWMLIGKDRKSRLQTVSAQDMNDHLNEAYLYQQFNAMDIRLRKTFPLHATPFTGAFSYWKALPAATKEMDHALFHVRTDTSIQQLEDSTTTIQQEQARRTDYILQHLKTMDYSALKDSIRFLSSLDPFDIGYYEAIVTAIAMQQPTWYLQLAEDNPQQRKALFEQVVRKRSAVKMIRQVQGHDAVKKELQRARSTRQWRMVYSFSLLGASLIGLGYLGTKIF